MSSASCAFAAAKINLTLRVLGRRPDGYHEIESLVAFAADVGDVVRFDPATQASFKVAGPFAVELAGQNLVERARIALQEYEPRCGDGLVELSKHLPIAAGIGGGSADAAAILRLMQHVYPETLTADIIAGVARSVGADVPVCVFSRAALMMGVGEIVQPVGLPTNVFAVLVNAKRPVRTDKTASVFAALRAPLLGQAEGTVRAAADFSDAEGLITYMRDRPNDLQLAASALMPEIETVLEALESTPHCHVSRLSGAGPTCIGLYTSLDDAKLAADVVGNAHPNWWVAPSALQ